MLNWTRAWALEKNLKLWCEAETDSTNTVAKDDLEATTAPELPPDASSSEPSLYLTSRQTRGRGRGNNTWTTPESGALLSSWSFALRRVPQPILAPLAGLALFEACTETWRDVAFNMKAPNDLYIGEKKTAGLLIETVDMGAAKRTIVGLGFNITGAPRGMSTATCLGDHLRQALTESSWNSFLNRWVASLSKAVRDAQDEVLSLPQREQLKTALNLHPHLKAPILNVDEKGQLETSAGLIRWQDL